MTPRVLQVIELGLGVLEERLARVEQENAVLREQLAGLQPDTSEPKED